MTKKRNKRTFESEALILPALKMVLVENEKAIVNQKRNVAKKRIEKDITEETVMRIIGKLSIKD